MAFIGASFAQVFYKKFNYYYVHKIAPRKFLVKNWLLFGLIGLLPFILIFIFGEVIFSFIFGIKWAESGKIASMLCPYLFLNFITSPTSTGTLVLKMQKLVLIIGLSSFAFRIIPFVIGYYYQSFYLAIEIFVIVEILVIIITNFFMVRKLKNNGVINQE